MKYILLRHVKGSSKPILSYNDFFLYLRELYVYPIIYFRNMPNFSNKIIENFEDGDIVLIEFEGTVYAYGENELKPLKTTCDEKFTLKITLKNLIYTKIDYKEMKKYFKSLTGFKQAAIEIADSKYNQDIKNLLNTYK